MRAELKAIQQDLGISFIHVTHTQPEALAMGDMVVVMDTGHIEQAGTAVEIYGQPKLHMWRNSWAAGTSSPGPLRK